MRRADRWGGGGIIRVLFWYHGFQLRLGELFPRKKGIRSLETCQKRAGGARRAGDGFLILGWPLLIRKARWAPPGR